MEPMTYSSGSSAWLHLSIEKKSVETALFTLAACLLAQDERLTIGPSVSDRFNEWIAGSIASPTSTGEGGQAKGWPSPADSSG